MPIGNFLRKLEEEREKQIREFEKLRERSQGDRQPAFQPRTDVSGLYRGAADILRFTPRAITSLALDADPRGPRTVEPTSRVGQAILGREPV